MADTLPANSRDLDQLTKSSEFWFSDGNIVLIADSFAFKVHRGQLERHSEFFSGLFTIPQPEVQPLVDNCHYVELHDKASDVAYFLRALYDGLYFDKPRATEFSFIAAVLRLSTKYLVDHLRRRCLHRLERDWPATLSGWDRRELESTDHTGRYVPRDFYAHPILVIELAIELNIPSVIPAALYDLSRYGPSKILGGTLAPIPTSLPQQPPLTQKPLQVISLSHDLLILTLCGRETGQRYLSDFIDKELRDRPLSVNCTNKDINIYGMTCGDAGRLGVNDCYESFYYIMLNMLRSIGGIACGRDADPLFTLVQAMEMLSRTDFSDGSENGKKCGLKMCQRCKMEFAKCATRAREEVWRLIPVWFGLSCLV